MGATREQKAITTLTDVLKKYCDDICEYCKYEAPCHGSDCDQFTEGIGDAEGKFPGLEWSCMDFDYGTCVKMRGTPCDGCFDNKYNGFVWKGVD